MQTWEFPLHLFRIIIAVKIEYLFFFKCVAFAMFSHEWRVGCQGQDLSPVITKIEFMEVQQAERNSGVFPKWSRTEFRETDNH